MVKANYFPFGQSIFGIMHPPVFSLTETCRNGGLAPTNPYSRIFRFRGECSRLSVECRYRLNHLGLLFDGQLGIDRNRDGLLGCTLRLRKVSLPAT